MTDFGSNYCKRQQFLKESEKLQAFLQLNTYLFQVKPFIIKENGGSVALEYSLKNGNRIIKELMKCKSIMTS